MVNHPPHYGGHPSGIECIEVSRLCLFDMGNAIKYIWRFEDKNGIEDLKKARWYLKDLLANGFSYYLPYNAKVKMNAVLGCETNQVRRELFRMIADGEPRAVIRRITELVGDE